MKHKSAQKLDEEESRMAHNLASLDLRKHHPFLGCFGGCEPECAAQVMFEIYKKTGRRHFTEKDFTFGAARTGIYEWSNPKYIEQIGLVFAPTDLFFAKCEKLLAKNNPEYLVKLNNPRADWTEDDAEEAKLK